MPSYSVPFSFEFRAPMTSEQARWLREELALTFHYNPVLDPDFPYAFGLLDRFSGLFLIKGEEDRWTLECRTYRQPSETQVARWRACTDWVVEAVPRHQGEPEALAPSDPSR
jgi:hypothetical protein